MAGIVPGRSSHCRGWSSLTGRHSSGDGSPGGRAPLSVGPAATARSENVASVRSTSLPSWRSRPMAVAWALPARSASTWSSTGVCRDGRRKCPVNVTGSGNGTARASPRAASASRKPPLGGPTVSQRWLMPAVKARPAPRPLPGAPSGSRAVSSSKACTIRPDPTAGRRLGLQRGSSVTMAAMAAMARKRVVIVGGGFGGLACAKALDGADVDVLLLDARNYHLFTPLLYQVATALLDPSDIAYPFRTVFRRSRNVRFRQVRVTGVDFDARRLTVAGGEHGDEHIPYDTLVLATGSANAYFGNPELAERTIGMKHLDEAMRLRNHVLSCLERAAQTADPAERADWLTFVIVGGGPTGVEYAGALAELLDMVLGRDFPELARGSARVVLVEGADRLLGVFHPKLGAYAADTLRSRGVEVRLSTLVRQATGTAAVLSPTGDGDSVTVGARTIVWSAGVGPDDPLHGEEVPRSRSRRLQVDDRLRLRPGVYAIGDVASVTA